MTVVALGVLGVYTYVSPDAAGRRRQTAAGRHTAPALAPQTDVLPALPTEPVDVEPVVAAPVRVPVTVLNATDDQRPGRQGRRRPSSARGWETPGVGAYMAGDVAATHGLLHRGRRERSARPPCS